MGLNIDDVLRANDEMSEAIARVRELHKPIRIQSGLGREICAECTKIANSFAEEAFVLYKLCPTIKALGGEQ
jgi:hypothetical protein